MKPGYALLIRRHSPERIHHKEIHEWLMNVRMYSLYVRIHYRTWAWKDKWGLLLGEIRVLIVNKGTFIERLSFITRVHYHVWYRNGSPFRCILEERDNSNGFMGAVSYLSFAAGNTGILLWQQFAFMSDYVLYFLLFAKYLLNVSIDILVTSLDYLCHPLRKLKIHSRTSIRKRLSI